jgi:hypothetical protein
MSDYKQLPLPFPPDTIEFTITQDGKYAGTYTVTIDWQDRDLIQCKRHVLISKSGKPYAYGRIRKRQMPMHRVILERKLGITFEIGTLQWSDHKDMRTLNNSRDNLRIVTPSQNTFNRYVEGGKKSGYRGVIKEGNKWAARIHVEGECIRLGTFETKEEAYAVRRDAELKYYGEYAPQK